MKFVIISVIYIAVGLGMVLWDYRKLLLGYGKEQTASSLFITPPRFLDNLSISTALIFILIWPIKLLLKN